MKNVKRDKSIPPKNIPVTMADVIKARTEAIRDVLYLVIFILTDKHGFTGEQLQDVAGDFNYYADSIRKGRVKWRDIRETVEGEYDLHLPW